MLIGFRWGSPGSDCVAWPKNSCDRNRASPIATRLITTPDTMWSTLNVTVAAAWMLANTSPRRAPTSSPMIGPHGSPSPTVS